LILVVVRNVNLAYPLPTFPNTVAIITAIVIQSAAYWHLSYRRWTAWSSNRQ